MSVVSDVLGTATRGSDLPPGSGFDKQVDDGMLAAVDNLDGKDSDVLAEPSLRRTPLCTSKGIKHKTYRDRQHGPVIPAWAVEDEQLGVQPQKGAPLTEDEEQVDHGVHLRLYVL